MRILAIVVGLIIAGQVVAEPLRLEWDAPQGEDLSTLKYRVYRKPVAGEWRLLTTTISTHYSMQILQWGHFRFRVTAIRGDLESLPSNEIGVFIDLRGKEEP